MLAVLPTGNSGRLAHIPDPMFYAEGAEVDGQDVESVSLLP